MHSEPLDVIPLWAVFLSSCVFSWLAMECGELIGRWRLSKSAQEKEGPVGAVVGAIMALLAFMLAFTFSLAATRFDDRRQLVLQEANAIRTAYLRAQTLPKPENADVAKLLREYLEARLTVQHVTSIGTLISAIQHSEQLQNALWNNAVSAAEKAPSDITGLFIESVNQIIDVHATRVMAGIRGRVPLLVWLVLMGLAAVGMGTVGYQAGIAGQQRSPAMIALAFAFAVTIYLIADLDRPREGLMHTSQAPLLDLQQHMNAESKQN